MECSTGSFKAGEPRWLCWSQERKPAHQLISVNCTLSWKSVLLLHKYRIILIDEIDFTLFIITSVALCVSDRGTWTAHNLKQPRGDWYENGAVPPSHRSPCLDTRTQLSEPLTQISSWFYFTTPTPSSKLTVYHDIRSGKHRQLINLSDLAVSLGEDYCATLLGMYVFSGEDCTSAFNGKGEDGALKKLEKNPRIHKAFMELGEEWNLKCHVLKQLEDFTCLIYVENCESSMDGLRAKNCARSWVRMRNSLPNQWSTWVAFLPATLLWSPSPVVEPLRSLI